ncbi:hypothetical protein [Sodalis sp. C49]
MTTLQNVAEQLQAKLIDKEKFFSSDANNHPGWRSQGKKRKKKRQK